MRKRTEKMWCTDPVAATDKPVLGIVSDDDRSLMVVEISYTAEAVRDDEISVCLESRADEEAVQDGAQE